MTEQTRPTKLAAGARIGIVNPAYWLEPERQHRATGVFEDLGYEVVPGKSASLRENQYAGSPAERAADMPLYVHEVVTAVTVSYHCSTTTSFVATPRSLSATATSQATSVLSRSNLVS